MKLYGRRRIKREVDRRINLRQEERDAIVWDVDFIEQYATVKIQGSNELIRAHYPQNWHYKPYWLKKGNAVRVRHKEGRRGMIEIIGEGRAIPTAITGDDTPTLDTLPDGILTGMLVTQGNVPGMYVAVSAGTYRISGSIYAFTAEPTDSIVMQSSAIMTMGQGTNIMGSGEHLVDIDAAPSTGYCRYDILVIGTDGVIDYIKGTEATYVTGPTTPSVPSNHILVKQIFVRDIYTEITNGYIGLEYTTPEAMYLGTSCGCSDCILAWSGVTDYPTCTITFTIYDQYDNTSNEVQGGVAKLTMMGGTGEIKGNDVYGTTTVSNVIIGSQVTFTYKRDQTENPEIHPVFSVTVENEPKLTMAAFISLLDASGDPI